MEEVDMKLLIAGLVLVGSLFIGAELQAQVTQKVYPGIMCQPLFPTTSSDDIGYDGFGRAINISDGTAQLNCPVLRDATLPRSVAVFMQVLKGTATTVGCTLFSRRPDGTEVARAFGFASGDGTVTGPRPINFTEPILAETQGYLHLLCDIPSGPSGRESGIISYFTFEF